MKKQQLHQPICTWNSLEEKQVIITKPAGTWKRRPVFTSQEGVKVFVGASFTQSSGTPRIELHAALLASQQAIIGTIPCARRVLTHNHKGIQLRTCSTWWTLLHDDGVCQHSSQHATESTWNDRRRKSKDHTSHLDTNRYGGLEEQKWPLDIQQPRIPGESAQNTTQSTLHPRPTVSSSNRKVGEL